MGVEPYLIASTLSAVIAQRLVRNLCINCRLPVGRDDLPPELKDQASDACGSTYRANANGCTVRQADGYNGRTAIYEVVVIDEPLRKMIHSQKPESELLEWVGVQRASLYQDGVRKVMLGETSYEEILRVTKLD
ncbi:hypothetical protein I6N98_08940 [Spongiibacter nanhainus]|uniref:Bacterial type II secretion system protein E domain-containing protein n=1 Tax=Spongiibacter nanhainus TaxID=2794344 RepID=A0A7T4USZ5_9GAMM|nr:hypothetical protein [Spongiibacter nanhainus]QQD19940.1 hypothetical protein I6N98_08940 [Spongiibacter nanhainus]